MEEETLLLQLMQRIISDETLQKYDDWLLAIAAYNAGPNRILKEIKKIRTKDCLQIFGH